MAQVCYLPAGPQNLKEIFKDIIWQEVDEYFLELFDKNGEQILTTVKYKNGCCCDIDNSIRIHFLNGLGTIDAVNFSRIQEELEVKADSWEKPLQYPLNKSEGGNYRFNVKSNEQYTVVTSCYGESQLEWLKELFSSPLAWMEWKGMEGQPDDYLPIVINDAKYTTRKIEERYVYEVQLQFKMSNENFVLRN